MSSPRHEQAEGEMIADEVGGLVKVVSFPLLMILLLFWAPWHTWGEHGHVWGLSVLSVLTNLIGGLIIIAVIASETLDSRRRRRVLAGLPPHPVGSVIQDQVLPGPVATCRPASQMAKVSGD